MVSVGDHGIPSVADSGVRIQIVATNGIDLQVVSAGEGPAVLLLHGFPHTWRLWSRVLPGLSRDHRVVVPDLRGLGGSTRAVDGYDAASVSRDLDGVLDVLGIDEIDVVGIDAGGPPAFALAMRRPTRVRRLVLMECTLGRLPGAEDFFAAGAPWWFGFHGVPGLAESVVVGHEDAYLDFFYRSGTHLGRGIDAVTRSAFLDAYRGEESLRCAFEYYRAAPTTAAQIAELVAATRLRVPTMAIGSHPVGTALHRQLVPVADDLRGETIPDCGHIIPLDRPDALLDLLRSFLGSSHPRRSRS